MMGRAQRILVGANLAALGPVMHGLAAMSAVPAMLRHLAFGVAKLFLLLDLAAVLALFSVARGLFLDFIQDVRISCGNQADATALVPMLLVAAMLTLHRLSPALNGLTGSGNSASCDSAW